MFIFIKVVKLDKFSKVPCFSFVLFLNNNNNDFVAIIICIIDLLIFTYVFLAGNWYGKWTAIDLYLTSWIRNLSVFLWPAHWHLCHPPGLLTWLFYNSMWFLGISNWEGVLPEFLLILTFPFYEYFSEVSCTAFYKILLNYYYCL